MSNFGVTIKGFEQIQAAKFKLLEGMKPAGALGKAVVFGTKTIAEAVKANAHEDTGTLRASILPEVDGLIGRVYTAGNRNPKSGTPASVYAPFEEARGGSHALYSRAFNTSAPRVMAEALALIIKELP